MQEDRLRTLIDLAEKKARTSIEGVSLKPLLLVGHPNGHWQIIDGASSPVSLPSGAVDKPVSLEAALETFILKR